MCIICNVKDHHSGDDFLVSFDLSRTAMKTAADAMLQVTHMATSEEHRKTYDRTHKAMVRLMREWNRLEQTREHHST